MLRVHALALVLLSLAACHDEPPPETPSAPRPARPVELHDLTLDGSPPDEDLAPRIAAHAERLEALALACYEPRLAERPDLAGVHGVRVWVSANQVIRVTPEETTIADPELEQCVKDALLAYEIPPEAPSGGVRVRFRLVFTPPDQL